MTRLFTKFKVQALRCIVHAALIALLSVSSMSLAAAADGAHPDENHVLTNLYKKE